MTAAFIVGGGPSVAGLRLDTLAGRGVTIAVNNAFQICPWADILYWADRQWFAWHRPGVEAHGAGIKATRVEPLQHGVPGLLIFEWEGRQALSRDPRKLAGYDSGTNAINLAFHLGLSPVVLFGFDMRPGHWHPEHPAPSHPSNYAEKYIPGLFRMAAELRKEQVPVFNASPGSALTCFPMADPARFL